MNDDTTKQKILLAAGPIFADHGFERATVREICGAAEVNVASVNYYFGDKNQLYLEAIKAARHQRADQFPFPTWIESIPPEQRLFGFVQTMLNRLMAMRHAPWQVRLLMREILSPSEACSELIEEYFRPIFEQLLRLVDDLVDVPLQPYERNQIGFSIIGQCLHYRYSEQITSMFITTDEYANHYNVDQLARHITDFSLAALKNRATASPASEDSQPSLGQSMVEPGEFRS